MYNLFRRFGVFYFALISLFLTTVTPVFAQTVTYPSPSSWVDRGLVLDGGAPGSEWDAIMEGITPASIVKKNGIFYLYYIGADNYIAQLDNIGPAHRSVGVATSTDGINWTKYAGNPILTYTSSGNPEEGAVSAGVFLRSNGEFAAYYGTNISASPTDPQVNANTRIATSTDGLNFTDQGIALSFSCSPTNFWGCGDEIHAVGGLEVNGTYYAFYRPNGTSAGLNLGVASGSSPTNLPNRNQVTSGGSAIPIRGAVSFVPVDATTIAMFHRNASSQIEVRTASLSNLTQMSAPVASYPSTSSSITYLDTQKRTWFMYYDQWAYMGLRTAPFGTPDSTGPSAPAVTATPTQYDTVSLSWSGSQDSETGVLEYNIYRDAVKIATTRKTNYIDEGLSADTTYQYEVSAVNLHDTEGVKSSVSAVQTLADNTAPEVEVVRAGAAPTQVLVLFDEPVEQISAENPSNYLIGNLTVTSASLGPDLKTVTLTTSTQELETIYTVDIRNIKDRASVPNTLSSTVKVYTYAPGLIGYWDFESDGGQIVFDSSGTAHPGVRTAGIIGAGKFGSGIEFDGQNGFISVLKSATFDNAQKGSHTVAAWVKVDTAPPNTTTRNQAYSIMALLGTNIRFTPAQQFTARLGTTTSDFSLTSAAMSLESWHHVAFVVNDSTKTISLYVNGQPASGSPLPYTGTAPAPWAADSSQGKYYQNYYIGAEDPLFNFDTNIIDGTLDDVRVYDRALTSSEVQSLFTSTPVAAPTPSVTPPFPGDVNRDGSVTIADIALLLSQFGQSVSTGTGADFNNNGTVDISDLATVLSNFGQTSSPTSTPQQPTATPVPPTATAIPPTATPVPPTSTPTPTTIQSLVNNLLPSTYQFATNLQVGSTVYVDSSATYTTIPATFLGAGYIQTANGDRKSNSLSVTFTLTQNATVYVGHDDSISAKPSWLTSEFTDSGLNISANGRTFSMYQRAYTQGSTVTLGVNAAPTNQSMYLVVIK